MAGVGYMVGKSFTVPAAVANPTQDPTLSSAATGGTVPANTYYFRYTWVTANGETSPNTNEKTVAVTGSTNTLTIGVPSFPTGVTSANVYVSSSAGAESYQGNIAASGGSLTITAPITIGKPLPSVNTTSYQEINPSVLSLTGGSEFDVHNVYYNASVAFGTWDGTTSVVFDSDGGAGARMGILYHCNANQWIRLYNTSATNTLQLSFDGVQTA